MDELKPEVVASEKTGPNTAGTAPRRPLEMVRPVHKLTKLEKTVNALRAMLPIAQKVLPLLDGQIGTVVSNFIGPQATPRQVTQSLLPLQQELAQFEKQYVELSAQVTDQTEALGRLYEQLESLRKLVEETVESQQVLRAETERLRRNIKLVAIVGLFLLVVVSATGAALFVHISRGAR